MRWEWPWVSRRAYELLEAAYVRTIGERDAANERAERMTDQLLNRVGFDPVSAPVRQEMKEAVKEMEAYLGTSQFEDVGSGMLSDEFNSLTDEPAN